MKLISLAPLLLLAGCATAQPRTVIQTQDVLVPVPAPCVPKNLSAAPDYVDTDEALLAAPEGPVRYQLLIKGRDQRRGRLGELEPVVRGCPKEK